MYKGNLRFCHQVSSREYRNDNLIYNIKTTKDKMSNYIESGKKSLEIEIKGLKSILDNSINETFEKVVKTILKTKGRVILTGMGKPGYIAHKAAATFASTGTLASYIHPGEASHGDLGMISKDDTVILLSSSGGTKELNDIMAYCKRFSITMIGITQNPKSILAQVSTILVALEAIEETNIINSPTTYPIMMLSYLDAVATALIDIRNFGKNEYKKFHPGGMLGISMLKVEELMHKDDELPLVYEDDDMSKIVSTMIKKPLGCVAILDKEDNLAGILTDGDFKRNLVSCDDFMNKKASEVMTKNPITVSKNTFALDAVKLMSQGVGENNNYVQVLLVVENKKVVGLIHIQDCLKAGVI